MFRKIKYQIRQCFQTLLFMAIFERMPFSAVDYTVKGAMLEAAQFPKRLSGVCNTLTFKLLPLEMLDSKALRICIKLSDNLVVQTQSMISKMDNTMLELDELKQAYSTDPHVSLLDILPKQVENFHTAFFLQKLKFSENVCKLLPKLKRGSEGEDQSLNDLIGKAEQQCKTAMLFVKEKLEQFDVTNFSNISI